MPRHSHSDPPGTDPDELPCRECNDLERCSDHDPPVMTTGAKLSEASELLADLVRWSIGSKHPDDLLHVISCAERWLDDLSEDPCPWCNGPTDEPGCLCLECTPTP